MWYGKFLVGKDCSKECYKESSTMITREGRQYGRALFNYIFNKAPEVFGHIPILVDNNNNNNNNTNKCYEWI